MRKTVTIMGTAAIAVAALAPAAASASGVGGVEAAVHQAQSGLPKSTDASYRVPAGNVEHRVSIVTVSGSKARASKERQELWLTATRSRLVATDAVTGKLRTEVVTRPGESRIFDAKTNRVTIIRDRSKTPPYAAATYEAALHLAYVQQGVMRVSGERTVNGRKALVLESVAAKWKSSDPGSRGTAVVDAETYAVYETQSILDGGLFNQTVETKISEVVPANGAVTAKLAVRKHNGAKVTRSGR